MEILPFEIGQSLLGLLIKLSQVWLQEISIATGHLDHVAPDFIGVVGKAVIQVSVTHRQLHFLSDCLLQCRPALLKRTFCPRFANVRPRAFYRWYSSSINGLEVLSDHLCPHAAVHLLIVNLLELHSLEHLGLEVKGLLNEFSSQVLNWHGIETL